MLAALPILRSLLLRSGIAALTAAVFYYFLGSAERGRLSLAADLPLWLLAIALLVLPLAFGSAAVARLSLLGPTRTSVIVLVIAAPVTCAASIYGFRWYMSELAPAVNWNRSWPLPAFASITGVALEVLASWRSSTPNRTVSTKLG